MKYFTSIEWILSHDDFMVASGEAKKQEVAYSDKTKKVISEKQRWKITNNLIKKKLKAHKSVKGICSCQTDILCEHRKKYLMRIVHGKQTNW